MRIHGIAAWAALLWMMAGCVVVDEPMPVNALKRYALCAPDEAAMTLTVSIIVNGVTSRTEVYHFPRKIAKGERFVSNVIGQTGLGPDRNVELEYGILSVLPDQTVRYRFKCIQKGVDRPIGDQVVKIVYGERTSIIMSQYTLIARWKTKK